jgi:hypothetical protein
MCWSHDLTYIVCSYSAISFPQLTTRRGWKSGRMCRAEERLRFEHPVSRGASCPHAIRNAHGAAVAGCGYYASDGALWLWDGCTSRHPRPGQTPRLAPASPGVRTVKAVLTRRATGGRPLLPRWSGVEDDRIAGPVDSLSEPLRAGVGIADVGVVGVQTVRSKIASIATRIGLRAASAYDLVFAKTSLGRGGIAARRLELVSDPCPHARCRYDISRCRKGGCGYHAIPLALAHRPRRLSHRCRLSLPPRTSGRDHLCNHYQHYEPFGKLPQRGESLWVAWQHLPKGWTNCPTLLGVQIAAQYRCTPAPLRDAA